MKIHVLTELRQPIGATTSSEIEGLVLKADGVEVSGLSGTVTTVRTDQGLLVTLKASAQVQEECSRCLKPVRMQVQVKFEEEYIPTVDPDTGVPIRQAERGDEFRISKDFFLDLTEGLRQYILMGEPPKPLCTEDCKGLCPECGTDLNQSRCSCAPAGDPRWGALAGLARNPEGR
jgi:uncharacterized protein